MRERRSGWRRVAATAAATAAVMWILLYAPVPFVIYEPGIAVQVDPMVEYGQPCPDCPDESGEDGGEFMLTAVRLVERNWWGVLTAAFDSDRDIVQKRDLFRGQTKSQYAERITVVMQGSQNNAAEAAYRFAGIDYEIRPEAIVVTDTLSVAGGPAGPLKPGDRLIGISGAKPFNGMADAVRQMQAVKADADKVALEVEDGKGERRTVELHFKAGTLKDLDADKLAALLGASGFTELRSLVPADSRYAVRIHAGEIGGPSAGLVFALQVIDLLTEGDLTKGARIAATGTITADGKVGAIGGVKQKVVATSEAGAELFLVPKANEKEARSKAKAMKTDMAVTGVGTLQEAIEAIAEFTSSRSPG